MRLTTRLFLLISILLILTTGIAVAVTVFLSTRIGRQEITERLTDGEALRANQDADLYDRLLLQANLLTRDADLIAYLAQAQERDERESIRDILEQTEADLGFAFALVTDADGYLLARAFQPEAEEEDLAALQPLMARAYDEFEAAGLWLEDGALFHAVAVPLVQGADELLGYFAMGFPVDDSTARRSKDLDGSEVVIALMEPPKVIGSTFQDDLRSTIDPLIEDLAQSRVVSPGEVPDVVEATAHGEPWLIRATHLDDPGGATVAVRYTAASLRQETAPFRRVRSALGLVGLASLLLGLFATYLLARRLTRPLSRLVEAAKAASGGDYDAELPVDRQDEIGALGVEFRDLLLELREKRDMEAYVATLARNLPASAPQEERTRHPARPASVTLLAAELRHYAAANIGDAAGEIARLERELQQAASRVREARGTVWALSGHRLTAVFEGPSHALRGLAVAIDLATGGSDPGAAPALALVSGDACLGPVEWQSQSRDAMCGQPVQILETLLREALQGEILLPITTRDILLANPAMPSVELPERRGVTTSLAHCIVDLARAPALATLSLEEVPGGAGGSQVQPGQVIADRFEVLSLAGRGGMGSVYRAHDRKLDDVVALKTLRAGGWQDEKRIELLEREIKIARRITHPHVLRVYDIGEFDGLPFISMEYVRGVTLRQLMNRTQRLPFSASLRLARQICQGLQAVHQAGILHHDLKPENVLLEPTGNARLMDFGIARLLDVDRPSGEKSSGTPYYMAPEQLEGGEVDVRADIFSLGILLFELFSGGKPFDAGKNVSEMMRIKLEQEPRSVLDVWPEAPRQLAQLLARCLEKSPQDRFPSTTQLLAALHRLAR